MNISLNIFLEHILQYQVEGIEEEREKLSFSKVLLLPADSKILLNPQYLYICRLSELIIRNDIPSDITFICLRDRIKDEYETEQLLKHVLIVNVNIDFNLFFIKIQDVFYLIADWITQMHECIIHNKTMQEVLDVSEKVMGNFISISNASLTLLAYTKNIACDDEIGVELVKNGYHQDATVAKFKKCKRFTVWEQEDNIIINTTNTLSKYTYVSKVFKFRNIYFTHVVMTCNNRQLTPGLLDLFKILLNNLAIYIELDWKKMDSNHRTYDSLISDLIENKNMRIETIQDRAKYLGISLTGLFEVLLIPIEQKDNLPVGRLAQDMITIFPLAKTVYYNLNLVVLNAKATNQSEFLSKIDRIMEKYQVHCGISAEFYSLLDISTAYTQAKIAAGFYLTKAYNLAKLLKSDCTRCLLFEDYYIYYLWGIKKECCQKFDKCYGIFNSCQCNRALEKLYQYDKKHHTDNYQLLYNYLINERKARETAEIMHMHRNNIIYRIKKIEEITGIDLNDASVRIKLFFAYIMTFNYDYSTNNPKLLTI